MQSFPSQLPQDQGVPPIPPPPVSTLPPRGQQHPDAWASGVPAGPSGPRGPQGRWPAIFVAAALVVLLVAGGTYVVTRRSKAIPIPPAKAALQLSLPKGQSFRYGFDMT